MIFDKQNMFSEAQDLAQTNATYASTNVIDLGAAPTVPGGLVGTLPIDPGRGGKVEIFCRVGTTFTTSAGGTLRVQVVLSAATALSTPTILSDTGILAVTNLTAGFEFKLSPTIPHTKTPLRYLGILYIIGTGAMTAGTMTAGLMLDRQTNPTTATLVT